MAEKGDNEGLGKKVRGGANSNQSDLSKIQGGKARKKT